MKEDIVAGLKAKFDQYDLWDVAERFYKDYKMDVRSDLMMNTSSSTFLRRN